MGKFDELEDEIQALTDKIKVNEANAGVVGCVDAGDVDDAWKHADMLV